jgi:N-methylhydantoinase B
VLPDRVPAPSGASFWSWPSAGTGGRPPFVTGELIAGGSGAGRGFDGIGAIETDATNCMNLPAESLEMDAPVRVLRTALREDSGGAGRRRGGLGTVREYEILEGEVRFTHRGERHFCAPRGRAGGRDGAMARTVIQRANGNAGPGDAAKREIQIVPSKIVTTLRAGDRVTMETAGGGGYGDPREREPARLEADVRNGKVSAAAAKLYTRAPDESASGSR